MTSIYSGKLYNSFVTDQNRFRLANYDVNRFQKTIEQSSAQGRLEKELRDGLEFHQAIMADLQTKLNEITEKLNNIYRRYMDNKVAFRKVTQEDQYIGTSGVLNKLPNVTDTTNPTGSGYVAGANGLVPFDDPYRVKNYTYNPFFGSKAIDESDMNLVRTYWEQPGVTSEEAYRENGAFWSSISYLWGWDLDRINATYTTTDSSQPLFGDSPLQLTNASGLQAGDRVQAVINGQTYIKTVSSVSGNDVYLVSGFPASFSTNTAVTFQRYNAGTNSYNNIGSSTILAGSGSGLAGNYDNLQVNVTALQPNKEQYPPLRVGDRFPIRSSEYPDQSDYTYPNINISGIRPGGADFGHAQNTADLNEVGEDNLNWGWEFDDLPLALQVTSVKTLDDGTVQATGYKVVYDIPPTHPNYERFRHLDGTEPQILDAPTALVKERIYNAGFSYTGFTELGDGTFRGVYSTIDSPTRTTNDHDGNPIGSGGTNIVPYPLDFASNGDKVNAPGGTYQTSATPGPYPSQAQQSSYTGGGVNQDPLATSNPTSLPPGQFMGTMYFDACETVFIDSNTLISFTYDYRVTQNVGSSTYGTPGDDGAVYFGSHNWGGSSTSNPYLTTNAGVPFTNTIDGGYQDRTVYPGAASPAINGVALGTDRSIRLGSVETIYDNNTGPSTGTRDPFHRPGGAASPPPGGPVTSTRATGQIGGTGPILVDDASAFSLGDQIQIGANTAYVDAIVGNYIYTTNATSNSPTPLTNSPGSTIDNLTTAMTSVATVQSGSGNGMGGPIVVPDAVNMFGSGDVVEIRSGGQFGPVVATATIQSVTGDNIILANPNPLDPTSGNIPDTNYFINVLPSTPPAGTSKEELNLKFREEGGRVAVDVYFEGDIHGLDINIQDLKIVNYNGQLNTWQQGLYNTDVPDLGNGPLPTQGASQIPYDVMETDSVINKFEASRYQFTQFYNEYNVSATNVDLKDILRSPYEYGMLNIGRETLDEDGDGVNENSQLSGELYLDINQHRLNFDHDDYDNATTQPDWSATATTMGTAVQPGSENYFLGANVQEVYDFREVFYPGDDCVPPTSSAPAGSRAGQAADSDPYSDARLVDGTLTPTDPMHSASNPIAEGGAPANFYQNLDSGSNLKGPAENDITGTVDRIAGTTNASDPNSGLNYGITIPTTDLNVLKKENGLVFNFGSLDGRGWSIDINEPFMEFRTVPDYQTIPRYRVDASGNIYDRFGKGYYDPLNADDAAAITDLYPTSESGLGSSAVPLKNGQISNHDRVYESVPTGYNQNGTGSLAAEMSPDNDDYNLFDYVPDLRDVLNNPEGAKMGELYVGSLPTNFYYYREELDNPAGDDTVPTVGDNERYRSDGKPALNFDGRGTNLDGQYNTQHTTVYNTEMPSFVNVNLGYVEQDAIRNNAESTTTFVRWTGFYGADAENVAASRITAQSGTIDNAINAVGTSRNSAAQMHDASSLTLELGTDLDQQGHLLIYESVAAPEDALVQTGLVVAGSGNGSTPVTLGDASFLNNGDVVFYEAPNGALTQITIGTRSGNDITFTPPFAGNLSDGRIVKVTPQFKAVPHVVPLPLEDGYAFSFDSYQAAKTMSRTGSVNKSNGTAVIHVDNAREFFNPPIPDPMQIVVGEPGSEQFFTIGLEDINTGTHPHTITVSGALNAANLNRDVPVRMVAPTFDIEVVDGDAANSRVQVTYDENGTGLLGRLASVEASPEMDRAGQYIGDDPRTAAVETNAIAPEYFNDQPPGYIEPDARLDLTLRAKDKDGNQAPRRLKEIVVTVGTGEQIVMNGLGGISQTYRTSEDIDGDGTISAAEAQTFADGSGDWPIALYDSQNRLINPTPTDDLGILVGYYQGIMGSSVSAFSTGGVDVINLSTLGEFQVGDIVTINGEQRTIVGAGTASGLGANEVRLNEPLKNPPILGDAFHLGRGNGEVEIAAFLNRSFAMSTGAPVNIDFIWEDYEAVGYPPVVSRTNVESTENVGFSQTDQTLPVADAEFDDMNYLVANKGRSGGSADNDFTNELKRIVDNPEYREVFRQGLVKNIFIAASVTDPFNDVISSKIMLDWDRLRRRAQILQTSFNAYYQSL